MVAGGKLSIVLSTTVYAQQNLGNLESFVNQNVAYEDAGLLSFGDGSGDYYGSYNDATIFENELFDSEFEDADADLFGMSSTISLTTTTPKPSTTTTTTTTTTTEAPPTRDPERMDSRLRGRPERPRFVAPVDDNLFDYYGDAMFGFGDYDGTQYDTQETAQINNRPSANVQVKSGGTSGYCRICDGEDAANCATRSAVQCADNQDACLVRVVGTQLSGYKFYSKCSTSSVCHDNELQNFVGPSLYHQCRSSTMHTRYLRNNSVCNMCYKQAASDSDANLFFSSAGMIGTADNVATLTVAAFIASPTTYLDNSSPSYLGTTQNW